MITYKHALASTILAVVVIASIPSAWADGALAVGGGSFGFSRNHESMRTARSVALERCGNDACEIKMTFRNSCLAYARASNGHWGTARRDDEGSARRAAIAECEDRGGRNCEIKTNRGYECDGD